MSREQLRKTVQWFEWGSLALLALDLILYAAFVVPFGNLAESEEERYEDLRTRASDERGVVEGLQKFNPKETAREVDAFVEDHVPPSREGYYRAARLVRELADQSGIELTGISYRPDRGRGEPLRRLAVAVSVDGTFEGLLKFAHEMETANDFVVLDDCNVQTREGKNLSLHLTAEMYLEP